jgi:hypothetical protein
MSTITTNPRSTAALPETITVAGEERHVMRGATWRFYDCLTDALGERTPLRVAYDGRDIETMTLGPKHERSKNLLTRWVVTEKSGNRRQWKKRLLEWIHTELKPRVQPD